MSAELEPHTDNPPTVSEVVSSNAPSEPERWLDDNNRYIAASLQWLRLRLQKLVPVEPEPSSSPPTAEAKASRSWFGRSTPPASAMLAAPTKTATVTDEAIALAATEREAAAQSDPPPALLLLAQRLGLSTFEREVVLLCAAAELDPSLPALCAAAQRNAARTYPTFGLAMQLFEQPTWDALSPHRPLRYARLLEINQPGATPLTASALRADERIVNYLKGLNVLDERLAALLTPLDLGEALLATSQQQIVVEVLQQLSLAASESRVPQVSLIGSDSGSKLAVAEQLAAALGRRLYRLSLEALPTSKAEIENLARLWQRESMLLSIALYLDVENLDSASSEVVCAFNWFVSREAGLVFVALRDTPGRNGSTGFAVTVEKPTVREQDEAWQQALQDEGAERARLAAQSLAGQFNLNLHEIRRGAQLALAQSGTEDLVTRAWDSCRRITQPRLDLLAQRIEPKAGWNDLVLSEEAMNLLRQVVGQVRGRYKVHEDWGYARKMTRGLGINALFAGESGTGKTMAAEVLANELRLALYRIDLSAVVSKYIGETEKNLRKLFDAAEAGGAILLFDEADALFGKRSEVKDSHDRYANIEINYLLQRMEAFSGLAILATNMKTALDQAFLRRLRFIVNFQFPGPAERKLIWQKVLPPEVPREALDFERLGRFSLSGGNVTSIALNASFAAAQRGTPVTMALLLAAVRTELRKLDKPINEAEFR